MSYGLPLEFDDRIFSSEDLVGDNYLSGFPDLMQGVGGNQAYKTTYSDLRKTLNVEIYGRSPNPLDTTKNYVYVVKGRQTVYAASGRAFTPGADIRIYNYKTVGATRSLMAARVVAYDELTGKLTFDTYAINYGVDSSSVEVNKIPTLDARVTIFGSRYVTAGTALAVANGGTGADNDRDALLSLGAANVSDVTDLFVDFLDPGVYMAMQAWTNNSNQFITIASSSTTPNEHPGQLAMIATTDSNAYGFLIGYGAGVVGKSGFSFKQAGSFIEYMILASAIPVTGNNYDFNVGVARSLGEHDVFGGFGVKLNFAVNTRFRANATGASDVSITAVTPTAPTWFKIRITNDGTNLQYTINGVACATISIASTTLDFTNDLFMPSFGFGTTARAGTPTVYVDYFHLKEFFNKPRG
jgi:hypothetical protein